MKLTQPYKYSYNGAVVTSFEKGHVFKDPTDPAYLAAKEKGIIESPKPKVARKKSTKVVTEKDTK